MNRFFALLFDPSGRIDRAKFWAGFASALAGAVGLGAIMATVEAAAGAQPILGPLSFFTLILVIVVGWVGLALMIKRLRDCGVSPWWFLVTLIPFIGPLPLVVLLIICGVKASVVTSGYDGVERIS